MDFVPFDITCYNKLYQQFQILFEPPLINEICQAGILRTYKEGDILIDIGQTITHIPLIVSGTLKILREGNEGKELLLYYLELGETCAITLNCCSSTERSTVRAVCEEDAEVLFIPALKMEEWMIKYKSWRNFVLDNYNARLKEMLSAIDSLAFHNMEERLKKYLADKAIINKSNSLQITHLQIAEELHSSRVVISRLMKKLELDQLIKIQRNRVEILNLPYQINQSPL